MKVIAINSTTEYIGNPIEDNQQNSQARKNIKVLKSLLESISGIDKNFVLDKLKKEQTKTK